MSKQFTQDLVAGALIAVTLGMAFPEISLAQVTDLSGFANQTQTQMGTVPGIITMILFVVGVLFVGLGIIDLKKHADNPNGTPLKNGIAKTLAGGAMVGLPALTGFFKNTLGMSGSGAGVDVGALNF
ncbi:MAG: hypothetical protein GC131_06945 [Alphaproteobacteria bacterium]|nr:hypothetical protein [Alphaproteobacteria bacterium]